MFLFVVFMGITSFALLSNCEENTSKKYNTVLLVSFDGFGWNYQSKTDTPNLDFIEKTGVKATSVRTVFKTLTWPSHISLVTGLYPENHGIVSNDMYDPVFDEFFNWTVTDPKWFNDSEPIWVTNQRHGGKSAVLLWPGFNVKIRGMYPTFAPKTLKKDKYGLPFITFEERINLVFKWLTSEDPPNLIVLYFDEPDIVGHAWGPNSQQMKETIRKVDDIVGEILQRLRKHRLLNYVNIILTSDHGQAEISSERRIFLTQYVPRNFYDGNDLSLSPSLWHRMGKRDQIYKKLESAHPHLKVYYKHEIPERLHYRNHRRIAPLLVVPDEGWLVESSPEERVFNGKKAGTHGFSNFANSMDAFFLASGPDFRKGFLSDSFDLVDIYPLMCKILGIQPEPNNGTMVKVGQLLKNSQMKKRPVSKHQIREEF